MPSRSQCLSAEAALINGNSEPVAIVFGAEHAAVNDQLVYMAAMEASAKGGVEFEKADGATASFPLDWRKAALANIQPRGVNLSKVAILQEEIAKLLIR